MNKDEHEELAELMLANAAPLSRNRRTAIIAGELVWGASVQAMHAAGHDFALRPHHPIKSNGLEAILRNVAPDPVIHGRLRDGPTTTQRRLHNNFYTANLSEVVVNQEITAGVVFVRLLLDLARRQD